MIVARVLCSIAYAAGLAVRRSESGNLIAGTLQYFSKRVSASVRTRIQRASILRILMSVIIENQVRREVHLRHVCSSQSFWVDTSEAKQVISVERVRL